MVSDNRTKEPGVSVRDENEHPVLDYVIMKHNHFLENISIMHLCYKELI